MNKVEARLNEHIFERYRVLNNKLKQGLSDKLMETYGCVDPLEYARLLWLRWFEYRMTN